MSVESPKTNRLPPLLRPSSTPLPETTSETPLAVCKECQSSLLHTFEHCLMKNNDTDAHLLLESILMVDEKLDTQKRTFAPVFPIVKVSDPTIKRKQLFKDPQETIDRDKIVWEEMNHQNQPNAFNATFSGNLFKFTMEAKRKEIQSLRQELYENRKAKEEDTGKIAKLQKALAKAVNYYTHAEEWQTYESSRLQNDVKFLKRYISSLMAYLIQFREEKIKLLKKIDAQQERLNQDKVDYDHVVDEKSQLQSKLQKTYLEYVDLQKVVDDLRKDMASSKELEMAYRRNEALTTQYDLLSKDFLNVSKQCDNLNLKVKQLEFEMDELVIQFNTCGESKLQVEEKKNQLNNRFNNLQREYDALKKSHAVAVEERRNYMDELDKLQKLHDRTKQEHEIILAERNGQVSRLTETNKKLDHEHQILSTAKATLEGELFQAKQEVDRLKDPFAKMMVKFGEDMAGKDNLLATLKSQKEETDKKMEKMKEQRDKAVSQATELKNTLDREMTANKELQSELKRIKKDLAEKLTEHADEVDKLNAIQKNLGTDKRLLTDEIRAMKANIESKDKSLATLRKDTTFEKSKLLQKQADLTKQLEELTAARNKLSQEFDSLTKTHEKTVSDKDDLQNSFNKLQEDYNDLQVALDSSFETLKVANQTISDLKEAESVYKQLIDQANTKLEEVRRRLEDTESELSQKQNLLSELRLEKDTKIKELEVKYREFKEKYEKVFARSTELDSMNAELKQRLVNTQKKYTLENKARVSIENELDRLRLMHYEELTMRIEFEKLLGQRQRVLQMTTETQELAKSEMRKHLGELAKAVKEEQVRMNGFLNLMPPTNTFESIPVKKV